MRYKHPYRYALNERKNPRGANFTYELWEMKNGKTVITAKIGKKKLKCKITVKQKVVKKKTVYQAQMVENFESYIVGTDWGNYTLGEGLTSGGNEPAHYLAKGETMKVITDPENANNKVLQVIPKFYSFCPVFTVDLEKLTADLRSQTTFDFVVGGSYGPANKEYLAWYLDDVELIY